MPKKLCAFRLSPFAFETFKKIAKDRGITVTAAVEAAADIANGALYGKECAEGNAYAQNSRENSAESDLAQFKGLAGGVSQ